MLQQIRKNAIHISLAAFVLLASVSSAVLAQIKIHEKVKTGVSVTEARISSNNQSFDNGLVCRGIGGGMHAYEFDAIGADLDANNYYKTVRVVIKFLRKSADPVSFKKGSPAPGECARFDRALTGSDPNTVVFNISREDIVKRAQHGSKDIRQAIKEELRDPNKYLLFKSVTARSDERIGTNIFDAGWNSPAFGWKPTRSAIDNIEIVPGTKISDAVKINPCSIVLCAKNTRPVVINGKCSCIPILKVPKYKIPKYQQQF